MGLSGRKGVQSHGDRHAFREAQMSGERHSQTNRHAHLTAAPLSPDSSSFGLPTLRQLFLNQSAEFQLAAADVSSQLCRLIFISPRYIPNSWSN